MVLAAPTASDPREENTRRLAARRARLASCEKRHLAFGNLRLLVLLAAIPLAYAPFRFDSVSWWWLLVPLALVLWLGARLESAEAERARLSRAVAFYERALSRLNGDWAGTGETGARFIDEHHLYARDLDIFGSGSLFQLLCGARTCMGEETLAAWLLAPAAPDTVRARQQTVLELAPRLDLREDLAIVGDIASSGVHPDRLASWGQRDSLLQPRFRVYVWVLSLFGAAQVIGLSTYVMAWLRVVELSPGTMASLRVLFLVVGMMIGIVVWRSRKHTERIILELSEAAEDLGLLAGVLRRVEAEAFSTPYAVALRSALDVDGQCPSERIARLDRLVALGHSRNHMIVRVVAPLLLWDLHLSYAVEDWRRTSGESMRRWLSTIGEIEALSSLAGYSYEHPLDVFPELVPESPCFHGEGLAHPLLAGDVIANDVHLDADHQLLVVSGSNMSGKSTLLRTIGVNAVLAQAGAPARARRLRLSPLTVAASIQVVDSLQGGMSRFYAEITRLRQIKEKTSDGSPVLFLVDEFLHGTNSHERRIAAEAIVRDLVDRRAIGLVTTHDLALAHIADGLAPRGANVHFDHYIEDGRMRFDYLMRPGVVQKSNALQLMRSMGLIVNVASV